MPSGTRRRLTNGERSELRRELEKHNQRTKVTLPTFKCLEEDAGQEPRPPRGQFNGNDYPDEDM